jgi:hypothetical protein
MKNHRLSHTQLENLGTKIKIGPRKISPIPQKSPITNQSIEAMLRI